MATAKKTPARAKQSRKAPRKKGAVPQQAATAVKKKAMLDALKKNLGNISQAAKAVGIERSTHHRWLKADTKYAAAAEEVTEFSFDFVESKIMKAIQDGNITMTIFYAKTKMKSRGYVERQEISIDDKPAFIVKENQAAVKKVMDVIHRHNDKKRTG